MRLPIHPSRSMPRHKQASLPERVYQGTLCIYRDVAKPFFANLDHLSEWEGLCTNITSSWLCPPKLV